MAETREGGLEDGQYDGGPSLTDNIGIYHILGWIGMFTGAILIMRVVLSILNDR